MAEKLSDTELRHQLLARGETCGPITVTTRPIYVRKLNSFVLEGGKNKPSTSSANNSRSSPGRRSIPSSGPLAAAGRKAAFGGFSSDESDGDDSRRPSRSSVVQAKGLGRNLNNSGNASKAARHCDDASELVRPSLRSYSNGYDEPIRSNGSRPMPSNTFNDLHNSRNAKQPTFGTAPLPSVPLSKKAARPGPDASSSNRGQRISCIVILLAVSFFIVLGYVYFSMKSCQLDTRSDYMLCSQSKSSSTSVGIRRQPDCVHKTDLEFIQGVISNVIDALGTRAGQFDCGYTKDGRSMSTTELEHFIKQRTSEKDDKESFESDNYYVQIVISLFAKNEHWAIHLSDASQSPTNDPQTVRFLESEKGKRSLWCRLTESAKNVFTKILLGTIAVGIVTGLLLIARFRYRKRLEEEHEVLQLVEKIIDMLKQHSDSCLMSPDVKLCLAIPHVRDALIPLHLRKSKQALWDRAVKFLSANESRVRIEMQMISGEG